MKLKLAFVLLHLVASVPAQSKPKRIKFGIVPTYSAPILIRDPKSGRLSGIGIDIINHISKNLKIVPEIVERPRRRIDQSLLDGSIDLVCYSNPAWAKNPEIYNWSEPFGEVVDVIFRYKGAPEIKSISDLKNSTIGTLEGYQYGKTSPFFQSKTIFRSDFFNAEGMMERMNKGQILYGIGNRFLLDYYQIGSNPTAKQPLVDTGFIDAQYKLRCRMLKSSRFSLSEINAAIAGFQVRKYVKK
jgi:polar amino acid transport system substrate-binding protein